MHSRKLIRTTATALTVNVWERLQNNLACDQERVEHPVTKDDANYPHQCLCPRWGCVLRVACPSFHFGQQEWTR